MTLLTSSTKLFTNVFAISLVVNEDFIVKPDGSRLAFQSVGDGPAIIVANGIGGTFHTWRHFSNYFAPNYRIISWDYRGMHASEPPAKRGALRIIEHTDDLELVISHLEIPQALFVGWSMGVQVIFEFFRRKKEKFSALIAINGTAGKPFETLLGGKFTELVAKKALRLLLPQAKQLGSVSQQLAKWDKTIDILVKLGIAAPMIDRAVFRDLAQEFTSLDFYTLITTMILLNDHDAWDVLAKIDVPALIVASEKDKVTPLPIVERMARAITNSTLTVLPGCSHYGPVELPDQLNVAVKDFLAKIKY